MEYRPHRSSDKILSNSQLLLKKYWIALVFMLFIGLAIAAPSAQAVPPSQRTVPTATPTDQAIIEQNSSFELEDVSGLFESTESSNSESSSNDDSSSSDSSASDNDVTESAATEEEETSEAAPVDNGFLGAPQPEVSLADGSLSGQNDDVFGESDAFEVNGAVPENSTQDSEPFTLAESGSPGGVVSASILDIYSAPDPDSAITGTLFSNEAVEILGRDGTGDWVLISFGPNFGQSGWVQAFSVALNIGVGTGAQTLPLLDDALAPPTTDNPLSNSELEPSSEKAILDLQMGVNSSAVLPGQSVDIEYRITNISDLEANDVSLRNEFPRTLTLTSATFGADGTLIESGEPARGSSIFRVDWPQLVPGQTVTVSVSVNVSRNTGYGVVIDNLAGVGATNADVDSAGVSLGTPPAAPPDFRISR